MFSKKAQMHMASPLDLVIILIGVVIGVALCWYGIQNGWPVVSGFCSSAVVPVA